MMRFSMQSILDGQTATTSKTDNASAHSPDQASTSSTTAFDIQALLRQQQPQLFANPLLLAHAQQLMLQQAKEQQRCVQSCCFCTVSLLVKVIQGLEDGNAQGGVEGEQDG